MNIFRSEKILKYLYWTGLACMMISIPIFNVGMSISIIWLAVLSILFFFTGVFFDLNIKSSLNNPFTNPIFILPAGLYFVHLIGMLYSDNYSYGLHDLRVKLPLLILPFALAYLPKVEKKIFENLLWLFVAASLFSVLTSLLVYWEIVPIAYQDVRDITVKFITRISHIRLALSVVLSLGILYYFATKNNWKIKLLASLLTIPFIYFIVVVQSMTGVILLLVLGAIIVFREIFLSTSKFLKYTYLVGAVGALLFVGGVVYNTTSEYFRVDDDVSNLPSKTSLGNKYQHNLDNQLIENNHYVWINIAKKELRTAWNKRSSMDFDGSDHKNQQLYLTLLRYMTSKGLTKDAQGMSQLSNQDVKRIENGVPNAFWQEISPLKRRMEAIIFEFDNYLNGGNPSGNSITQRLEFWKAGWHLFRKNPWLGCGTGDIEQNLAIAYDQMNSPLDSNHRLHCHNQYLTIAASFGIFGLLVFLVMVFYGVMAKKNRGNFLYLIFTVIALLSFVSEDTLETQAGVSFYSFFFAFLLLSKKN